MKLNEKKGNLKFVLWNIHIEQGQWQYCFMFDTASA